MKTPILLGLLLLPAIAQAQTEKGRRLVTGSASLKTSVQYYSSSHALGQRRVVCYAPSVSVSRGVFVKDNWLLGTGLDLSTSVNLYHPKTGNTSYDYRVGLSGYARRYWSLNSFRVFLGGGMAAGYYQIREETLETPNQSASRVEFNQYNINPFTQLGGLLPISDRLAIDVSATSNAFPVSFNSINVGMTLLMGGPKTTEPPLTVEAFQTQAGHWVLGGSLGFGNTSGRTRSSTETILRQNSFDFSPSVGVFVRKNLQVGVALNYLRSYTAQPDIFSQTSVGVTPYVKKYLTDNRLRPFVQGSASFLTSRHVNSVSTTRTKSYGANLSVGLAYMLGERFIAEAALGNLNASYSPEEDGYMTWAINATGTLKPTFTINYVFD